MGYIGTRGTRVRKDGRTQCLTFSALKISSLFNSFSSNAHVPRRTCRTASADLSQERVLPRQRVRRQTRVARREKQSLKGALWHVWAPNPRRGVDGLFSSGPPSSSCRPMACTGGGGQRKTQAQKDHGRSVAATDWSLPHESIRWTISAEMAPMMSSSRRTVRHDGDGASVGAIERVTSQRGL